MEVKHTPGPWHEDEDVIQNEQGVLICSLMTVHDFPCIDEQEQMAVEAECLANMYLIMAAPDLFEAAIEVCKLFGTDDKQGLQELHESVRTLRTAVKKARGPR